jgi:DNA-binding NarL/FixJ family response regulator
MEKILIIDDDRDMQSLLSDVIRPEGYEVITASNGKHALREITPSFPDLTLLDIKLPGMDGMKVLKEIKKIDQHSIVIMLTGYGDIKDAVQSMKMGAFNYITKPFDNEEMIINIKEALEIRGPGNKQLSPREKEVLTWLKNGKTSWDISIILCISERTVNFHIKNIMQKLDAVSRIHAVAKAIEKGLININ